MFVVLLSERAFFFAKKEDSGLVIEGSFIKFQEEETTYILRFCYQHAHKYNL